MQEDKAPSKWLIFERFLANCGGQYLRNLRIQLPAVPLLTALGATCRVPDAVVEVDYGTVETPLVQQFELRAHVGRAGTACRPHRDGHHEQAQLVHQPGLERPGGEPGPPTLMSALARTSSRRSAAASKSRSILVLALETLRSVLEYTILTADRQIWA